MLNYEDIARWFTLTINAKSGFPCIRIYDDVLANLKTFRPEVVASIRTNLGLSELRFVYQEKPDETFGFGNGLRRIDSDLAEQTTYELNLPVINKFTNEVCKECKGTKKANWGSYCPYCSGSGREHTIVWDEAFALSASIAMLAEMLEFACGEQRLKPPDEKQLLILNFYVAKGMHGGSIGGRFSPHFISKLKSYGDGAHFDVASEAMIKVYRHMWKSRRPNKKDYDYDKSRTKAWQNLPGNLLLDVPGDACGIHPSPHVYEIRNEEGIEFTCHNVDSPLQQLTLLTGLAAMCDMVG